MSPATPCRSPTARRTFSRTVRRLNSALIWNVRPMPRLTRPSGGSAVTSVPPSRMRPELGISRPVTRLMKVVLPAPFGPISACRAPTGRWKSMLRATGRAPNDLHKATVSSAASATAASLAEARQDAVGEAEHAAAREQHDQQQEETDPEQPVRRVVLSQLVLRDHVERRPD